MHRKITEYAESMNKYTSAQKTSICKSTKENAEKSRKTPYFRNSGLDIKIMHIYNDAIIKTH